MEKSYPEISFDNTEFAFEYKSDKQLKKAHFLFSMMGKPWLVKIGTRLAPWSINAGLPVKGIIRNTIFSQFVGGETLEQTAAVASMLGKYNVQVILDYGVEGKEGENNFDQACEEFIRVINYAATQPNIPFMSVKVTGFARFSLLEKLDTIMHSNEGSLMKRYLKAVDGLSKEEKEEWQRIRHRVMRVCEAAAAKKIGVSIDAEETWIQDPVDALTILMMDSFNKESAIVFNTLQHYRHDRLKFLKDSYEAAVERKFILGAKLVRGAYMEKERRRAVEKGYPSPIHPDKENTDRDFNAGVKFCIDNIERVSLVVASHNEYSNLYAARLLMEKGLPLNHPHVHWSQLFGMSDNITFNLAHAGCSVSKYLPFGPIKDVVPYLMRRAQENTSVKGQTGRELGLIKKELKRRNP
ncbi:MAG: proline dehydrogenase family protein [Chitinophagaceae bacterium]|nr:proline dehydrogenase family protein [Chitinophagaceae bacterium]HQV59121.1 proline dehydrogenase family protein [Chitinophagaceae bacterium]HQV84568.1 proline dehydrogenase family protein [Chitinophagaceae bacterium]HQX72396.1 proline dehydrogenase family protein [Chitinophagaceae bacterium]HQZ74214.1 proline dehydrogenase family protein [Chitinophagaceae bacterium]